MLTEKEIERRRLILFYIRDCLIGEIPKNLRLASASWDESSAVFYFYFDGEIDERDREGLDLVLTHFIANFTEDEMSTADMNLIRIDEPKVIKYIGECFFARKEQYEN